MVLVVLSLATPPQHHSATGLVPPLTLFSVPDYHKVMIYHIMHALRRVQSALLAHCARIMRVIVC